MANNILSIGVSGLLVHQTALSVTGNNIANADVPHYSRQRVELGTRAEQYTGAGYLGNGSIVNDIARLSDEFLLTQLRTDTTIFSSLDIFTSNIEQIDSLFADEFSGLSPAIEDIFEALGTGAEDPTSMPSRQLVISSAEGLVERFNTLHDRLNQQNLAINDQIKSFTEQVTTLAQGIAEMNVAIEEDMARGQGRAPNQLLDRRDELLRELSELITVRMNQSDSGAVDVFIGNGQPLVVGATSNGLLVAPSVRDPGSYEVLYAGANYNQIITGLIGTGGKLGGLLNFRDTALADSYGAMGRLALAMAGTLNDQQNQGLDFEGNFGRDIFTDINNLQQRQERAISDTANALPADRNINVQIDDIGALTTSDYTLLLSDPDTDLALDYQLIRTRDGTVFSGELPGAALPQQIVTSDGFSINLVSGSYQAGDRFFIRPTRNGARDIDVEIQRPQELAYAAPVIGDASLSNRGSGTISSGTVLDVYDATGAFLPEFATAGQLSPPILIRFTNPTTYNIYDNTNVAAPVLLSAGNGFTPGQVNTVQFGAPTAAYQIELNGFPVDGDEFTVSFNGNGTSDNRNAVQLVALRGNGTMEGGALNYEDAYGRMVETLGSRTAQSRISKEAAQSLLSQSRERRESLSGVSLDEEAANLIRFEQAYNAAAQVINVARQLFDTLLAAFR